MKPLLGIDLDGVLADFNSEFLTLSRRVLNKPPKDFVVQDYHYEKCGWSEREIERLWTMIRHTDDFYTTLKRLDKTSRVGTLAYCFEYFFITARVGTDGMPVVNQGEKWLKQQYGLKAPFVIADKRKGQIARELDLDHFIDDKVENCLDVKGHHPDCNVYLMSQSYNQSFDAKKHGIQRVESVNEWLDSIKPKS